MCQLSSNLRAWNPQGLSSPVQGSLYLYLYLVQLMLSQVGIRSMGFCNLSVQNVLDLPMDSFKASNQVLTNYNETKSWFSCSCTANGTVTVQCDCRCTDWDIRTVLWVSVYRLRYQNCTVTVGVQTEISELYCECRCTDWDIRILPWLSLYRLRYQNFTVTVGVQTEISELYCDCRCTDWDIRTVLWLSVCRL